MSGEKPTTGSHSLSELSFFKDLQKTGLLIPQTEVISNLKTSSYLEKTFTDIELYCKRFLVNGWDAGQVHNHVHNVQSCFEYIKDKTGVINTIKMYYEARKNDGFMTDKQIENKLSRLPSEETLINAFHIKDESYKGRVDVIWHKDLIKFLEPFWSGLLKELGIPYMTTPVNGGREKMSAPEHQLIRSLRFDGDDPADSIENKKVTIRMIIPDAGIVKSDGKYYTSGHMDVWLGKEFIPPNYIVCRRDNIVEFENEQTENIKNNTSFFPYDYRGGSTNFRHYVRWNESWLIVIFDLDKFEEQNGTYVPVWNVYSRGRKPVMITPEGKPAYRKMVDMFSSERGKNNRLKTNTIWKGDPTDYISWLFGDAESAIIDGEERVVRLSGSDIAKYHGFSVDYRIIELFLANHIAFKNGKGNLEDCKWFKPRNEQDTRRRNSGENATIGDIVNGKKLAEDEAEEDGVDIVSEDEDSGSDEE